MSLKKIYISALLITSFLAPMQGASAHPGHEDHDETTKRRPDKTEFVTESHVRLTTASVTVAEVSEATAPATTSTSWWDIVMDAWTNFVGAIRSLF
jgi:hypothetical protein